MEFLAYNSLQSTVIQADQLYNKLLAEFTINFSTTCTTSNHIMKHAKDNKFPKYKVTYPNRAVNI